MKFDPPLYFEAQEICGKPIRAFIKMYSSDLEQEFTVVEVKNTHCVNYSGHENSKNPKQRGHYFLIEELVHSDVD